MKKILALTSIAIAMLMVLPSAYAPTTSNNTDFDYIPQHIALPVDPNTIIPSVAPPGVPYCTTRGRQIVCYTPDFIRKAYNVPTTLDGSGQTIVIVDAFGSPTIAADLAHFDAKFGIPFTGGATFTILCGNGGCPAFQPNNFLHDEVGWSFETTLDVEWAHAIAPGANIVLDVAATSSGNAINDAEATAIAAFPGAIISQSFGIPEILVHNNNAQTMQAHQNYLNAQAALDTVFASAGDTGATNGFDGSLNALFPASDPLNTAVGGTEGNPYIPIGTNTPCNGGPCTSGLAAFTGMCRKGSRALDLTLIFPSGCTPTGYGGEQVWNEVSLGIATGGAPSILPGNGVPGYQAGLGLTSRTTPDVTYNAAVDGGVLSYYSATGTPRWVIFGGTSAGSPQWAGIAALANQAHGSPLGFLNDKLYAIPGAKLGTSTAFHDIIANGNGPNNNKLFGTQPGFAATVGWDDASGLGSPDVTNLILAIA